MRTLVLAVLCLLLTACNLPASDTEIPIEDQAATIVALTMSAQPRPSAAATAPGTPTLRSFLPAASPTVTATVTATGTITPTYSTPILTINQSTHCRSGPGQTYPIVTTLGTGRKAEIVGRYEADDYWIIKNPDAAGTCWIWGAYSIPAGSHWAVPTMTPPPTATLSLPAPPRNLQYTYFCTLSGEMTTTLTWDDRATTELGYRIFRKGAQIAELPANSNTFSETINISPGETVSYGVAAFNVTGESAQSTISFSCQ